MSTDADRIIQREYERVRVTDPIYFSEYDAGYLAGLEYARYILENSEE